MSKTSKPPRKQCSPSEANWYVEVIYGRTLCPDTLKYGPNEGKDCRNPDHARKYGTETGESSGYFKGDRPTAQDRDAMVPNGFYRLESTVTRRGKGRG